MKKSIFSGFLLLFFSLSIFAANKAVNKNVIKIEQSHPQLTIKEVSNPTTGYQWSITYYDQKLLKLVKSYDEPPVSQVVGASGKKVWIFEALPEAFQSAPMTTHIKLTYARPWSPEDHPKVVEYLVVVKK